MSQLTTDKLAKSVTERIAIAIPTYGRDEVLVQTIAALLQLQPAADELIIVDQTPQHDVATEQALQEWHCSGRIRWVRRTIASITGAMNDALRMTTADLVLFLDDDIRPAPQLIAGHLKCHRDHTDIWASVGQVIQPWQQPGAVQPDVSDPPTSDRGDNRGRLTLRRDLDFPFHSGKSVNVANVMAGNLCVRRSKAIQVGGFDENFRGVAYRFETDFARRIVASGGTIRFCPTASIDHLRVERGGTRMRGNHLASADPIHGVGDYYYALRHGRGLDKLRYITTRLFRELRTRFHLTHPWWIPVKATGELRALWWAVRLVRRGPHWIDPAISSADISFSGNSDRRRPHGN